VRLIKIYILPLIAIMAWLSACKECAYDYSYEVRNETSSELKIFWTQRLYSLDSLILKSGETKELFTTGHGIGPCGDIPVFSDVDQDLESFEVVKMDSINIESNVNYLFNDSWEFIDGTYRAIITESEF